MRALVILVAATAIAGGSGCSSDPCDGQKGTCLSVLVKGNATGMDRLLISVDKPTEQSMQTPTPPTSPLGLTLPLEFALTLPAGTTGPVKISIDGLEGTTEVAHTSQTVTVPSSGRESVTFTLNAHSGVTIPPDLGADMATPADMNTPITVAVTGESGTELETMTTTITANDPTGKSVTIDVPSLPTGATKAQAGNVLTITWTPTFAQAGSYPLSINVTASDPARNVTQPLTLTVANGADPLFPLNPNDVVSGALPANIIGDFDMDGFADVASCSVTLVTGTSHYEVDVLYGDATGLPTATPLPAARLQTYLFSFAVSTTARPRLKCVGGDFDGDGYSDIVLADPASSGNTGELFVVRGTPRVNSTTNDIPAIAQASLVAAEGLGTNAILVGDFDGNMIPDFATETYPPSGANVDDIYVFGGVSMGPMATYWVGGASAATLYSSNKPTPICNASGGQRIAQSFGVIDNTSKAALLVFDPNAGAVVAGDCPTKGGMTLVRQGVADTALVRPATTAAGFGDPSVLCDVDGDGAADLVATDSASGNAYVFFAPLAGGTLDLAQAKTVAPAAGHKYSNLVCVPNFWKGSSLLLVDTASPSHIDIVSGAARAVSVIGTLPNPSGDMQFGTSIGSYGDVNKDGKSDLAVGTPSGKYWVIYGR